VRALRRTPGSHVAPAILILSLILASAVSAAPARRAEIPAGLLAELQRAAPGQIRVGYNDRTGLVQALGVKSLSTPLMRGADVRPEPAARAFLERYGPLFGLKDQARELTLQRVTTASPGRSFSRFRQAHQGVPVFGGEFVVQTDGAGQTLSASGKVVTALAVDTRPAVAATRAAAAARAAVAKAYGVGEGAVSVTTPELWIYNAALVGMTRDFNELVWRAEATIAGRADVRDLVLVDAARGFIALRFNQVEEAKYRLIYTAANTYTEALTLVREEGGAATGDTDADNAYTFSGYTYDFYFGEHGRDGIDDAGMAMASTVHYGVGYANAYWSGTQMVYGDGFAASSDVVAHELTHGVTDHTSNLIYLNQSGAINESLSDVWGNLVQLTYESTTAPNRWLMGESLSIGAIRSMSDPTVYGDPDRMGSSLYQYSSWTSGSWDNGGVHSNSGVNNKACYLMVDGGTFNGQTVTGLGISKVADLYYEAQTNLLTSSSDYPALYSALLQAAVNLGYSAADQAEILKALTAVEMSQQPPLNEAADPVAGTPAYSIFYEDFEAPGHEKLLMNILTSSNYWFSASGLPTASGDYIAWGFDFDTITDHSMTMTKSVGLPANSPSYLYFKHAFDFEAGSWDGGVVEYSTDGATWTDASPLITQNGYNGTISAFSNPLNARAAYVNSSSVFVSTNGYAVTKMDLATLAGKTVAFRFRIGTDNSVSGLGWFIDDVRIYMVQAAAVDTADLNRVLVAPNPYNPHSGDVEQGRPFEANNWATGIIFHNVTSSVDIEIYTVQGQLVARLHGDNTNGRLQWDVRTSDGRDVESGMYLAVIRAPSGQKATRRFMVIR
jgi:Zn-dependent metalloprotease